MASSSTRGDGAARKLLQGKLAIVTGSSRGIGAAVICNLAAKGCSVVINYTSDSSASKAATLASRLEASYGTVAITVQADMGEPSGPASIVAAAKQHFTDSTTGSFQIDIIVNNAGVVSMEWIQDFKVESFRQGYAVNVLGPLLLMQAALPYLPHDRSGRIVNVSSVSSQLGCASHSIYGGSKAALEAMTRTWARELASRATVNAVNPGPVATDMYAHVPGSEFERMSKPFLLNTPLAEVRPQIDGEDLVRYAEAAGGRPAYDHEAAGVICMLCTPDAAWCTGSVVNDNGGMKFCI
ncbi:hypothetical protein LTR10_020274 [Elasticomyces elasticus]|uniref:3-oxoacyl-[acyl-carrier-protein] reductase n=1 Tax=Exophiala sideris TaxID=1016849 RepID=A0ABR0IVM2_9EURO|nr:hypothetical protein LTR10_020274 [Elasticomyces elasticus]KAK5021294.1 hypothetical protein LTS07_011133 [Exophiala sideris]KAK5024235.1 hypothetical protein LTR13_010944 [Exophiala sideris]KAK5049177.1 hypothetical protein LTR69_011141 [Exophiala sideris]KAK5176488.1 hypothetical protein LTR44_010966 [Eurotiomycetes sp. CCFEE 6388]